MPFDKNFEINVMYEAANAAYLVMNVPQPPLDLPDGFALLDLIRADPKDAAAAMPVAMMENADENHERVANNQRMASAAVAESSIFGLVALNVTDQTVIVAIRGTKTIWEWVADIDALPVPFIPGPDAGPAHMGFLLVYMHIRRSILDLLRSKCQGAKRIWVTGHSLGGALAEYCCYDIQKNGSAGVAPEMHTFAGPRGGDIPFAGTFNKAISVCYRIVNFMDVVPQVPLPPLYQHVGQEVLVHGGFKPLDVAYAHHLTTYLAGLKKLP